MNFVHSTCVYLSHFYSKKLSEVNSLVPDHTLIFNDDFEIFRRKKINRKPNSDLASLFIGHHSQNSQPKIKGKKIANQTVTLDM